MLTVGGAGFYLYASLKQTLLQRSDYAVLGRVDHFRKLLRYDLNLADMQRNPQLFENMLGNEDDIFIISQQGRPVVMVNPRHAELPELPTVGSQASLEPKDLRSGITPDGIPLRAAAAEIRSGDASIQVVAAHLLVKEMAMLDTFRQRIAGAVLLAFLLTAAMGFLFLRRGLKPLHDMADHAAAITPARLNSRLDPTHTPRELNPLTEAFNGMLDRLADGYQRLVQFSADLAHEIRTPIGSLMGICQVTLQQPRSVDEYQSVIASNLEELERISRMVESILFLARAEEAQAVLDYKTLALEDELQRVADYFEGLAEERELRLVVEGEGCLQADQQLLRRALSNLVANAVRYADAGSVISIRAKRHLDEYWLQVVNVCPRLAPEQVERLFDRFYRADASRQGADSNGLGLAIVTAIMRLHNGSADVEQGNDQTICFTLRFPVNASKGQTANAAIAKSLHV
jgi:two-component system heavy metal sensor histidine kinase CusS